MEQNCSKRYILLSFLFIQLLRLLISAFVPILFFQSNYTLDSNAVSCCKTLDTSNGDKRETAGILLKRGRTILKRRYDSRKHMLRNSLFKAITGDQDLHKASSEGVNVKSKIESLNKNRHLPNNSVSTASGASTVKQTIGMEDKLIFNEETQFCPALRIHSQDNKHVSIKTDSYLANENYSRRKTSRNEFSKSHLRSDKKHSLDYNNSPIIAENYPKLYISVPNTEKNALTKNSLLKNIRAIQNTDKDSYGINISNSRFFVPKNYIFSGVESSMDDLKFEVDPEMGKLLQRSYSTPLINTSLSSVVIDTEENRLSLSDTIGQEKAPIIDKTVPIDLKKQYKDFIRTKALPDTSFVKLRPKKNIHLTEQHKQGLYLKKRESKSNGETSNSLLDDTTLKCKTITIMQTAKQVESSKGSHDSTICKNEKDLCETKCKKHEFFISDISHDLQDKASELNDDYTVTNKCTCDISASNCNIKCDKNTVDTRNINAKYKGTESFCEAINVSSTRQELDPSSNLTEVSSNLSTYPSLFSAPLSDVAINISNVDSINKTEISKPLRCSLNSQEEQDKLSVCNTELQESKCLNISETNRLNRIRFLQSNLKTDSSKDNDYISDSYFETTTPENNIYIEKSKPSSQNITVCKDQSAVTFGRTASLREKFETIVEDVELRSQWRSQIGKSCDCKSFS